MDAINVASGENTDVCITLVRMKALQHIAERGIAHCVQK